MREAATFVIWSALLFVIFLFSSSNFVPRNPYLLAYFLAYSCIVYASIRLSRRYLGGWYIPVLPIAFIVLKWAMISAGPGSYREYSFGYQLWTEASPTLAGAVAEYLRFLIPIALYEFVNLAMSYVAIQRRT
ncbi:MAG TPA: hypothetical protein VMF90_06835 [Rhizobiaceae bacterium]|nr:hypothetical protein [Rhizobiaceae bacterium]